MLETDGIAKSEAEAQAESAVELKRLQGAKPNDGDRKWMQWCVWVYSCGSRVNEGEMEKHQEDHAAAMERLYSPQRSRDIIMSSAPCSFLHCLIVEVLPLLTSKHFFTKPLAQLFGFWSSCLSLLT